jgi:hypothetical protein
MASKRKTLTLGFKKVLKEKKPVQEGSPPPVLTPPAVTPEPESITAAPSRPAESTHPATIAPTEPVIEPVNEPAAAPAVVEKQAKPASHQEPPLPRGAKPEGWRQSVQFI